MSAVAVVASVLLIYLVLLEAFETMILPRRVTRHFRFTRLFYLFSWSPWSAVARMIASGRRRGTFLSLFGPLSILALFGFWAVGLVGAVPARDAARIADAPLAGDGDGRGSAGSADGYRAGEADRAADVLRHGRSASAENRSNSRQNAPRTSQCV